jgi:hypothetical protein
MIYNLMPPSSRETESNRRQYGTANSKSTLEASYKNIIKSNFMIYDWHLEHTSNTNNLLFIGGCC